MKLQARRRRKEDLVIDLSPACFALATALCGLSAWTHVPLPGSWQPRQPEAGTKAKAIALRPAA